jgi:hypothetical protein
VLDVLLSMHCFLVLKMVKLLHVLYVVTVFLFLFPLLTYDPIYLLFYQFLMLLLKLLLLVHRRWTTWDHQMLGEDLLLVFNVVQFELRILLLLSLPRFLLLCLFVANLFLDELTVGSHVFSSLLGILLVQPLGVFDLFFSIQFFEGKAFLGLAKGRFVIRHGLFDD